jgi:NADH dehydrogenase
MVMNRVIIVGAGFGGLRVAKQLERKFRNKGEVSLTLVDQYSMHQFTPNLYEIASSDEELTTTQQLKSSITIPLQSLFLGTEVKIITDTLTQVDGKNKTLQLENQKLSYDYLVLALGSVVDFSFVPTAKDYALPMKTVYDALRIRNEIAFAMQRHRLDSHKYNLRILIAGGGYTGVEFAAELARSIKFLAWKNDYPEENIEISIIEAASELIPGLNSKLSADSYTRLRELGVRIQLSSPIAEVGDGFVILTRGDREAYDVLVWSTGVRGRDIPFSEPVMCDRKNRVCVETSLQLEAFPNIFVLGDCASVLGPNNQPVPQTAQEALSQASIISANVTRLIKGQKLLNYKCRTRGFIVTLGGPWAISTVGGFYIRGFLGYLLRVGANFSYFGYLLGWFSAIRLVLFQTKLYSRND